MTLHSSEFHPVAPGEQERNGFYHTEYPSEPDSIDRSVDEFEQELVRHYPFLEQDGNAELFNKLSMGFREIAVNAIYHGNLELTKGNGDMYKMAVAKLEKETINKKMKISGSFNRNDFEITIEDEGKGFERKSVSDPLSEEGLGKESGRGLLLTESFYDEMDVVNTGYGTRVTLKKKIKLPA